jgi:hypothetical protein
MVRDGAQSVAGAIDRAIGKLMFGQQGGSLGGNELRSLASGLSSQIQQAVDGASYQGTDLLKAGQEVWVPVEGDKAGQVIAAQSLETTAGGALATLGTVEGIVQQPGTAAPAATVTAEQVVAQQARAAQLAQAATTARAVADGAKATEVTKATDAGIAQAQASAAQQAADAAAAQSAAAAAASQQAHLEQATATQNATASQAQSLTATQQRAAADQALAAARASQAAADAVVAYANDPANAVPPAATTVFQNTSDGLQEYVVDIGTVLLDGALTHRLTLNYKDADGTSRSIQTTISGLNPTNGNVVNALNSNSAFRNAFGGSGFFAKLGTDSKIHITLSDPTQAKSIHFDADDAAAYEKPDLVGNWSSIMLAFGTAQGQQTQLTVRSDAAIALGNTFDMSYRVNGAVKTARFLVTNATNGTVLNTAVHGTKVYALNSSVVSGNAEGAGDRQGGQGRDGADRHLPARSSPSTRPARPIPTACWPSSRASRPSCPPPRRRSPQPRQPLRRQPRRARRTMRQARPRRRHRPRPPQPRPTWLPRTRRQRRRTSRPRPRGTPPIRHRRRKPPPLPAQRMRRPPPLQHMRPRPRRNSCGGRGPGSPRRHAAAEHLRRGTGGARPGLGTPGGYQRCVGHLSPEADRRARSGNQG